MTGCTLVHCSIGYDGAVLDPRIAGDEFWPIITYIDDYPGLVWVAQVPLDRPIDLDEISMPGPKPAIPTIIRWLTHGLTPAPKDCVSTVIRALRSSGVDVPNIVCPKNLQRWLVKQEYDHASLE